MTDLAVSSAVLGAAVLLSEAPRRAAARLSPGAFWMCALEAASTFQLCSCTHELKLLGQSAGLGTRVNLTICFAMTVVHLVTFREATCNPAAALESVCRGTRSLRAAVPLIACQFAAAVAAQFFAASVWSLGLSDLHVRHQRFGFRCFDPIGGTLLEAAAVELTCAFVIQTAAMQVHNLDEKLRVPFLAAVVTALVYTGVINNLFMSKCLFVIKPVLFLSSGCLNKKVDEDQYFQKCVKVKTKEQKRQKRRNART